MRGPDLAELRRLDGALAGLAAVELHDQHQERAVGRRFTPSQAFVACYASRRSVVEESTLLYVLSYKPHTNLHMNKSTAA